MSAPRLTDQEHEAVPFKYSNYFDGRRLWTAFAAEFNQRPSQVKRAAEDEPVVVTEHGRPSFVLLTYAEYQLLLNTPTDLAN